jgi:hypothetical protein
MPVTSVANTTSPVNVTRQTNAVSDRPTLSPQMVEGISKVKRSLETLTEFCPSANSLVGADSEISSGIFAALSKNTDALTAIKLVAQDVFNSFPESAKGNASEFANSQTRGAQAPSAMWFKDIACLLESTMQQIAKSIDSSKEKHLAVGIQNLETCIKAQQVIQQKLSKPIATAASPQECPFLELPQLAKYSIVENLERSDKSTFDALSLSCKEMRAQVLARVVRDTTTTVAAENLAKKLLLCPNLSKITLTGSPSVEQLGFLRGNATVKDLYLRDARRLTDAYLEILGTLPSLEHLTIGMKPSEREGLRSRTNGKWAHDFSDAGLEHLQKIQGLKTLGLGESSKISANGLERLLRAMPSLEQVDERECFQLSNELMQSPEKLARLKNQFGSKLVGVDFRT